MKLRFTGEWPPIKVLNEYPNCECAIDEEDLPGQDETTLKPCEDQTFITDNVEYTSGIAYLNNGSNLPCIIGLYDQSIGSLTIYTKKNDGWKLNLDVPSGKWQSINEEWLPKNRRSPTIDLFDKNVFPLRIESRLKLKKTNNNLHIKINPDGSYSKEGI